MKSIFISIVVLFLSTGISLGQKFEVKQYHPVFIKDKGEHHPEELERSMKLHGRWIQIPKTGYVWRPNDVPSKWNPVKEGHRAWSPAVRGYVMEYPERPWGWLPLEEGHWAHYSGPGWVWVPNQTHIVISPDGISLHFDLFNIGLGSVPPPPPAYYPEAEEEDHPRGHAYGHHKHDRHHDEEEDDD
jgi:hypothetical protein